MDPARQVGGREREDRNVNNDMTGEDEQAERIREEWRAALEDGIERYSIDELADIFEDRDPVEFI